jgi:hypothetical protein
VSQANSVLWFYGYVTYFDIFNRTHFREFMWEYSGNGLRPVYHRERIIPNQ